MKLPSLAILIFLLLYTVVNCHISQQKLLEVSDYPDNLDLSKSLRNRANVATIKNECAPHLYGMFADYDSGCQTYHLCHAGRRIAFSCPPGTLFNQFLSVCDHEFSVNCKPSIDISITSQSGTGHDQNYGHTQMDQIPKTPVNTQPPSNKPQQEEPYEPVDGYQPEEPSYVHGSIPGYNPPAQYPSYNPSYPPVPSSHGHQIPSQYPSYTPIDHHYPSYTPRDHGSFTPTYQYPQDTPSYTPPYTPSSFTPFFGFTPSTSFTPSNDFTPTTTTTITTTQSGFMPTYNPQDSNGYTPTVTHDVGYNPAFVPDHNGNPSYNPSAYPANGNNVPRNEYDFVPTPTQPHWWDNGGINDDDWTYAWLKMNKPESITRNNFDFDLINRILKNQVSETPSSPNPWTFPFNNPESVNVG